MDHQVPHPGNISAQHAGRAEVHQGDPAQGWSCARCTAAHHAPRSGDPATSRAQAQTPRRRRPTRHPSPPVSRASNLRQFEDDSNVLSSAFAWLSLACGWTLRALRISSAFWTTTYSCLPTPGNAIAVCAIIFREFLSFRYAYPGEPPSRAKSHLPRRHRRGNDSPARPELDFQNPRDVATPVARRRVIGHTQRAPPMGQDTQPQNAPTPARPSARRPQSPLLTPPGPPPPRPP